MSIQNPVAFIGEAILGATAGAPLSTSSSGLLASGISTTEFSFSSNITTTSTSNVVMTGMTTTPASGTYLVLFSSWFSQSTGGDTITISIYVGGTQKADSVRTLIPFSSAALGTSQDMAASTNGLVTVNGSQAIAIYWSVNGGTATAHAGTMNVMRVS